MYKNKLFGINDTIDKCVELINNLCDSEHNIFFNLCKLDDVGIALINLQFEINNPHLDLVEVQKLFKEIKEFDPDYKNDSNSSEKWEDLPSFSTWQHLLIKLEDLLKIE